MHAPSLPDRSIDAYAAVTERDRLERLRSLAEALSDVRILHVNSTATGGGGRGTAPFDRAGLQRPRYRHRLARHGRRRRLLRGHEGDTQRPPGERRAVDRRDESDLSRGDSTERGRDRGRIRPCRRSRSTAARHARATRGELPPDAPIVWRCHVDLTDPADEYRTFVSAYVDRIDHGIFSRSAYAEAIDVPETSIVYPSIDPVTEKNRSLDEEELRPNGTDWIRSRSTRRS